jgi:lipoprotein NlpI
MRRSLPRSEVCRFVVTLAALGLPLYVAADEEPKDAGAFFTRGVKRYQNGEYDLAIADFDQAIRIKPDEPDVLYLRG